jgi:hypothetical protein
VRPRNVVVREVGAKQGTQVAFAEDDDEIEVFAANRTDDALGKGTLPGSTRCDDDQGEHGSPLRAPRLDGEKTPLSVQPLERRAAALHEPEPGADDEVLDRA